MATCIKNISQPLVIASLQQSLKIFFSPTIALCFLLFLFLQEARVGDKQTVAPSKDVLSCRQLPLQGKLLLYHLKGVLMPVHPNRRCKHTLRTSGNGSSGCVRQQEPWMSFWYRNWPIKERFYLSNRAIVQTCPQDFKFHNFRS